MNRYSISKKIDVLKEGDSLLIMNFETGKLFKVSGSGLKIFELLASGKDLKQIVNKLIKVYDVETNSLLSEVRNFTKVLIKEKIISKR